jgi:hypothetical protein
MILSGTFDISPGIQDINIKYKSWHINYGTLTQCLSKIRIIIGGNLRQMVFRVLQTLCYSCLRIVNCVLNFSHLILCMCLYVVHLHREKNNVRGISGHASDLCSDDTRFEFRPGSPNVPKEVFVILLGHFRQLSQIRPPFPSKPFATFR